MANPRERPGERSIMERKLMYSPLRLKVKDEGEEDCDFPWRHENYRFAGGRE